MLLLLIFVLLQPGYFFMKDPFCLNDCYPDAADDHCLNALLDDFRQAGGICQDSWMDYKYPGEWPVSSRQCTLDERGGVLEGLCSAKTEALLLDQENCVLPLFSQKLDVWVTIDNLILSMCKNETWVAFWPKNNKKRSSEDFETIPNLKISEENQKLTPVEEVYEYQTDLALSIIPPLENTKHRYPWICSLRSKDVKKTHYCGVTLLSRPPAPTVIVGAAHCILICKSPGGRILPNCCCDNIGGDECNDNDVCEEDAEIVDMTGDDMEIICGEWETGPATASDSGELYNIVLPITDIVKHPHFDISRGELNSQFVAADIAVFKVNDDALKNTDQKINPACLPKNNLHHHHGIHSGWSHPAPLEFLQDQLPHFAEYYRDFRKQWHYNMTISDCQDPDKEYFNQNLYKYASNSYYPPATLCATEITGRFCPSSGESGSPLMTADSHGRYMISGILSFIKGCSQFSYDRGDAHSYLVQYSDNPSVYTKVSCYLPWIANQYNMIYEYNGEADSDCFTGHGNIKEVTAEVCRTNPSIIPWIWFTRRGGIGLDRAEAPCLFPYTLDGKSWETCIMAGIGGLTHPIFKCPIRTLKNRGTSYRSSSDIASSEPFIGYCPTNSVKAGLSNDGELSYRYNDDGPVIGPNGELEVDPDNDKCGNLKLPIFSVCKNNCPGGKCQASSSFIFNNSPFQSIFLW